MSMIRCGEKCIHQKNGYCDIDCVTNTVINTDAPCIYFKSIDSQDSQNDDSIEKNHNL